MTLMEALKQQFDENEWIHDEAPEFCEWIYEIWDDLLLLNDDEAQG